MPTDVLMINPVTTIYVSTAYTTNERKIHTHRRCWPVDLISFKNEKVYGYYERTVFIHTEATFLAVKFWQECGRESMVLLQMDYCP